MGDPVPAESIFTVCGTPKRGAWQGLWTAITAGDPALATDAVPALDEAGRREAARELPGPISLVRKAIAERDRRRGVWTGGEEWSEPMRVAGAGVLSGAAAVTAWLPRRDFTRLHPTSPAGSRRSPSGHCCG